MKHSQLLFSAASVKSLGKIIAEILQLGRAEAYTLGIFSEASVTKFISKEMKRVSMVNHTAIRQYTLINYISK